MPPATRTLRSRQVTDENDENAATQRLTRGKVVGKGALESVGADPVKKPLQRTRSNVSTSTKAAQPRKRAALGDVSNVAKNEAPLDRASKDAKKPLAEKGGLLSKAGQPTRVQKVSKSTSTRTVLKEKSSAAQDLKRPASGSGIVGNVAKKRHTVSSSSSRSLVQEPIAEDENVAPASKTSTTHVQVEQSADYVDLVTPQADTRRELPPGVPDLDEDDADDPLMVSEYVGEIFEYLGELELQTMANDSYMDNQPDLEWKMRGILVDWLLEVHTRFRLLPETMFLAVNIIDRFLSAKVVQLDRLQLVGITAMFIASKYEEVLSPHVQNFRHVADDGFTEDEILSAERFILSALDYNLSYPNPMNFLRRISKADNYDIQTRTLGKYLLEIGCLDHRFISYPSSQVAAAAMYLARLVLEKTPTWEPVLTHYAGYSEEEIRPVLLLMIDYLHGPVAHEAFFKKYASKKFMKASIVIRGWVKDHHHEYLNQPASKGLSRASSTSKKDKTHF